MEVHSRFLDVFIFKVMVLAITNGWLSFVVSNCEFVTFPLVSWVWYLIVSIPDLSTLTFNMSTDEPKL